MEHLLGMTNCSSKYSSTDVSPSVYERRVKVFDDCSQLRLPSPSVRTSTTTHSNTTAAAHVTSSRLVTPARSIAKEGWATLSRGITNKLKLPELHYD
uniref:Uncharacterized protein n=1 Tax=Elaeophora elaphi TaxID=1147741 RepID=A0A0R3RPV6_9BILA